MMSLFVSGDLPRLSMPAERALGFFHIGTGFWLFYLMFAAALNFVFKQGLPLYTALAPP